MTDTNGIEYTTWDEQKPSHPPVSKAVRVAAEHARITQQVYDEYWYYVRNHAWCGINWPVMESLANRANMANDDLLEARNIALNDDSLQECTCRPDADYLCPVCKAYTDAKYGDDIPYGGE